MINFVPKYGTDEKAAILEVLEPEENNILLVEFEKCRVNIESKEQIDAFICQLGNKYQVQLITSLKATDQEKEKVVLSGSRKCQHAVRRHSLKNAPTHSGPERQPGSEREPGKNTCCSANNSFSLSGEKLHSSKHQKMSLRNQHTDKYPLEFKLSYIHNHSINVKVNLSSHSKVIICYLMHPLSTKETCWRIRNTSKLWR